VTGEPFTEPLKAEGDKIIAKDFITMAGQGVPVIDVRSPAEFARGHIPGALNIPLFSNEQRAIVGTIYKEQGKEAAVQKGLELVAPAIPEIASKGREVAVNGKVLVYCWRGGMRSGAVAWLLKLTGLTVKTLVKGYKGYRRYNETIFSRDYRLNILGGKTGSGKTKVLQLLKNKGAQVLDLEGLAHHKGSSFGAIGEHPQPTQEQFENNLAGDLGDIDTTKELWVEDESRYIGSMIIPEPFWKRMREQTLYHLNVDTGYRIALLLEDYTGENIEALLNATRRIEKRLGGVRCNEALEAIGNGDMEKGCSIVLEYYDKAYQYGVSKRDPQKVVMVDCPKGATLEQITNLLISAREEKCQTRSA